MPLSDMYRTMLEATNPATWETNRQKQLMGEYELESKRRSMDAEQQLRQLYSSGGPVSTEKVMSISPQLGIELQKAGNQAYLQQLQAQETKGKIDLQSADQAAAAAFPALIIYQKNIQRGMPEAQAREMFHSMNGKVVADAAQSGATWLQSGASYDPNKVDPENVRALNARFGRFTPFDKLQQESQTEAMKTGYGIQQKQAPGAREMQQEYIVAPDGVTLIPKPNRYLQPPMGKGPMPQQQGGYQEQAPYQFTAPSGQKMMAYDLGSAAQALHELPEGPDKEAAAKWLDEQWFSKRTAPKTKQEVEVETARKKKQAELDVEEQAMSRKATNAYDMLPSPDRIRNLIKGSVSGDLEYWANRAGGVVGKSLEAGDMTGALKVIEGQMADTVAMFPGAQSDKELEARMKTIGNPSGEISADTRLKAFDEWQERMQKYAAQHADYDDTKLLEMVKDKKLTADQALQIRKRRMSGGL